MILRLSLFYFLLTFVFSRTVKDDVNHLLTKSGRILIGVVQGNMEGVHLGINEGGSINAILEPFFGDMVLRLGKAYVSFPSCPAIHLCFNYGTKDHLNVAALLIRYGANANHYRLPSITANGTVDLLDRGYPPALMYALGMGQIPHNTHAAMLQRMIRTNKDLFNFTVIDQWRKETGNPPIVHLCLLLGNVDGAHVLLSELGMDVNEADADGVTALHISAWRENLSGMVMLLRQGANASAEDHMGRTPLHYVVMRGHTVTALKILLASALSDKSKTQELQRRMLTQADRTGKTVYDFAAAAPMKVDILEFLQLQAQLLGISSADHEVDPALQEVRADVTGNSEVLEPEGDWHDGGWHFPSVEAVAGGVGTPDTGRQALLQASPLSLGVDILDAEALTAETFLTEYFSAQRPLLVAGQLAAGAGIWAHWMREDFLARYGSLQVSVGPGSYAETRAALRYERLVANDSSFCVDTSRMPGTQCKASRQSTYRKTLSVVDYAARCLTPPDSAAMSTLDSAPRCSWEGHAAHASLQLREQFRWDVPTPGLFASLCRTETAVTADTVGETHNADPTASTGENDARRRIPVLHDIEEPMQLHLGGVHSGAPLQAHNASWHLLLAGKKLWFLLPPSALSEVPQEYFVCDSTAPGVKKSGTMGLGRGIIACVETAQEWLLRAVPRLRELRLLVEVTQFQGDVLYIPHDWQYATLNLADTVAVSKEMCTFRNSDARVQPLGSVIYGRNDPHRGIGLFQLHRKSNTKVGIKIKPTSKVPQFDNRPAT